MVEVFIGLGSNLGNGPENLLDAWRRIGDIAGVVPLRLSHPWRTSPVGMASRQWFTNAVGLVQTSVAPEELLAELLAIERAMGRDRSQGADRIIDLDILLYGSRVITTDRLTVPHPEMCRRLFVLEPLVELAPRLRHPESGLRLEELLAERKRRPEGQQAIRAHWPGEVTP